MTLASQGSELKLEYCIQPYRTIFPGLDTAMGKFYKAREAETNRRSEKLGDVDSSDLSGSPKKCSKIFAIPRSTFSALTCRVPECLTGRQRAHFPRLNLRRDQSQIPKFVAHGP
jgi:hypothetical protein